MKRVLKGLFAFAVEIVLLPISILMWAFTLSYAAWYNRLDKDEWKTDLQVIRNIVTDLWKTKIAWINS